MVCNGQSDPGYSFMTMNAIMLNLKLSGNSLEKVELTTSKMKIVQFLPNPIGPFTVKLNQRVRSLV